MESSEAFNSLEGHLKSTDEIDLVVLRGHLILEQCLNALLVQWISTERLPKLNLNFARKLELYVALQEPRQHWPEEIAHLRELNRIRNKLAHQLPSKLGHHVDVKKWACAVVGYTPKSIDRRATYRSTVLKAFYLLTGYLAGAASMQAAIKARDDEARHGA
jgi:hypothetical protein